MIHYYIPYIIESVPFITGLARALPVCGSVFLLMDSCTGRLIKVEYNNLKPFYQFVEVFVFCQNGKKEGAPKVEEKPEKKKQDNKNPEKNKARIQGSPQSRSQAQSRQTQTSDSLSESRESFSTETKRYTGFCQRLKE